jgi:hypothetical protein
MGRLCVAQRAKAGAAEIALEEWRHALQRAGAPEYPVSEAGDSGIRVAEGAPDINALQGSRREF